MFYKKMGNEPDISSGVEKNRKFRDLVFIPIFALFWVGMFIVCATAIKNGDIKRLIIPRDYLGNYCGINNNNGSFSDNSGKKFLYYLNPFNYDGPNATFICVSNCPSVTAAVTDYNSAVCRYDKRPTSVVEYFAAVSYDTCAPYTYSSLSVLYRCLPKTGIDPLLYANTSYSAASSFIPTKLLEFGKDDAAYILSDLYTTWSVILVCSFLAVFISLGWLYVAHYVVGPFVWISITFLNLVMIVGSIFMYIFYKKLNDRMSNNLSFSSSNSTLNFITSEFDFLNTQAPVTKWEVNLALGIFVTVLVITCLFLLVTIAMIKRIKMAIEIINEASEAFRKLPGIQFVPLFFCIPLGLLFVYFIYVMLYLMSPVSDSITISGFGGVYSGKNTSYYMVWYHLAGVIWTFFTLQGMLQLIIAGAVAEWYWTRDKSHSLTLPLTRSAIRAFKYSFGSVIIGALLITIVELIRIALYEFQKKIAASNNVYLKYLVACAQCCMKCLEVVIKFINRNAYVYIAITGKSFFASAAAATALLFKNAAKTVAVTYVAEVTLILAKIAIVGINSILAYLFVVYNQSSFANGISNPTSTVVLVGAITYMVASLFLSNYQLAVDTIFLSALEDLDKNDGSAAKPYYMSKTLQDILHKRNEKVDQL